QKNWLRQELEQWLGGAPDMSPRAYDKASPINYAHKDAAPMLFLHGTADQVGPLEQARIFVEKMRSVGGKPHLRTFAGAAHDFDEMNTLLAASAARTFLDRQLRPLRGAALAGK